LALAEDGVTPPGIDPEHQRIRSASLVLPADASFLDGVGDAIVVRVGVAQTSV
jgi:hypothetical protein